MKPDGYIHTLIGWNYYKPMKTYNVYKSTEWGTFLQGTIHTTKTDISKAGKASAILDNQQLHVLRLRPYDDIELTEKPNQD